MQSRQQSRQQVVVVVVEAGDAAAGGQTIVKKEQPNEEEINKAKVTDLLGNVQPTLTKFNNMLLDTMTMENKCKDQRYQEQFHEDVKKLTSKLAKAVKVLEIIKTGGEVPRTSVEKLVPTFAGMEADYATYKDHAQKFGYLTGKSGKRPKK